jgi:four helix bundle protein
MEDELKYFIPEDEFMVNEGTGKYNVNRGYTKLRVWNDSIDLYVETSAKLNSLPYDIARLKTNALDCCQSISRNIAEGYCRNGIAEYLNFLNFALGSCGEYFSCLYSIYKANQLRKEDYEALNDLHYKVENELIKLMDAIAQKKRNNEPWQKRY